MDGRFEIFTMLEENIFIKKYESYLSQNENLSNYSWFNLGGNAEYFYKASDKSQLLNFLKDSKQKKLKTTILGAGSNTLFRDNGVKGVVIKLGKGFSYTRMITENILEVGAATLDRIVANFAKNNDLGNLEFLSCIPGSIGGAIIMNSGCYDNDMSEVLISLKAIDMSKLKEIEIKREDIKFSYRGTNLPKNLIILSAKLQAKKSQKDIVDKKQSYLINRKKLSQPSQIKTCGSTFKNVNNSKKKAWMLIKDAGCENFEEGDAKISKKHCNFFVNNGNAKSFEIEKLINRVKQRVKEKTGVTLELEIKIVGEKKKI